MIDLAFLGRWKKYKKYMQINAAHSKSFQKISSVLQNVWGRVITKLLLSCLLFYHYYCDDSNQYPASFYLLQCDPNQVLDCLQSNHWNFVQLHDVTP